MRSSVVGRWLLLAGALAFASSNALICQEVTVWADLGSTEGGEVTLHLDGNEIRSRTVEVPNARWEIVLYLDQMLSRSRSLHQAADAVIEHIDELVKLGDVRIVHADTETSTAVPETDDRGTLETGLYDVLFRTRGREQLRRLRSDYRAVSGDTEAADQALTGEKALLEQQRDILIDWIAEQGVGTRPRLLLLTQDALGLDSDSFYGRGTTEGRPDARSSAELLLDTAAAYGWVVAPFALPESAASKRLDFARSVDVPVGMTLRFGGGDREGEESTLLAYDEVGLEPRPIEGLASLARGTGGVLIDSSSQLAQLIRGLAKRRPMQLVFPQENLDQVIDLGLPGQEASGLPIGPMRVGIAPTSIVSEVRLRGFLRRLGTEGDLATQCLVEFERGDGQDRKSRILVQTDLSDLIGDGPVRLRVTAGIQGSDGNLRLQKGMLSEEVTDTSNLWSWSGEIALPSQAEAVVVLVEEMQGATFGTSFASFVRSLPELDPSTSVDLEELKPKTRLVRIEALPAETQKRRIDFSARIDETVARLVVTLNGEQVAELSGPPWTTRIKLDRKRTGQIIEAIGYDAQGRELDRDLVVINAPAESFWVRIVDPRSGDQVGPVTVEADVRIPDDAKLDRVDFYWNDRLVATSRERPHRHTLLVPYAMPEGFIRVEAKLADGKVTEDLVLMNSSQFREHVEVEIVELLVVVTNNDGEPVNGLSGQQFRVLEEGIEQEIRDFRAAGDLPLTVGLAIDSSLSLFKRFPQVQKAARAFVESLVADRDHAFLVGFGNEARLVQDTTSELDRVAAGIQLLHPAGLTLVWEGIVLSLLELEPSQGRKALVVFYDGDDEDEKSAYRTALGLAEQQGVPIYLIVMNNAAARTGGKSFSTRSFTKRLDDLARAGGGRVFYVSSSTDLNPIFERISNELRSHYRLTYYPESTTHDQRWRSIAVKMTRRDLEARTVSGYEPGLPK